MASVIIQANLHHSKAATDLLMKDLLQLKPQVVALAQEPWVLEGIPAGIHRGLGSYHHSRDCRTAVFSKGCNLLLCPKYTNRDMVTCQVTLQNGKELYLVLVYADISIPHLPLELDSLLEERGENEVIIAMDANAHSTMWGPASNHRGNMVEEYILRHNLLVCNKGQVPTFVRGDSKTCIDITLCTEGMVGSIKHWKVDKGDHLSDHKRILFGLNLEVENPAKIWVTKKANWPRFSTLMREKSNNFTPPIDTGPS